jgi:hypothetical protein
MKHKEIIRLINSSQQQQPSTNEHSVDKENKKDGKRVVAKKGREPPKMDVEKDEEPTSEHHKSDEARS